MSHCSDQIQTYSYKDYAVQKPSHLYFQVIKFVPIVLLTASMQKRVSNMLTRVWSVCNLRDSTHYVEWKLQVTFYTYFMLSSLGTMVTEASAFNTD